MNKLLYRLPHGEWLTYPQWFDSEEEAIDTAIKLGSIDYQVVSK